MKKLFFTALLCFTFTYAFAQYDTLCNAIPLKDGRLTYTGVVDIKDASAKELYSNTKIWIAETFVSPKTVIKSDVENSSVMLSGLIFDSDINSVQYRINFTLQFKDGRYRYELTNINLYITKMKNKNPIEEIPAFANKDEKYMLRIHYQLQNFIDKHKDKLEKADYSW